MTRITSKQARFLEKRGYYPASKEYAWELIGEIKKREEYYSDLEDEIRRREMIDFYDGHICTSHCGC